MLFVARLWPFLMIFFFFFYFDHFDRHGRGDHGFRTIDFDFGIINFASSSNGIEIELLTNDFDFDSSRFDFDFKIGGSIHHPFELKCLSIIFISYNSILI